MVYGPKIIFFKKGFKTIIKRERWKCREGIGEFERGKWEKDEKVFKGGKEKGEKHAPKVGGKGSKES